MQILSNLLNATVQTEFAHQQNTTADLAHAPLEDKQEVVARFKPAPARSVRGVGHLLAASAPTNDYNTNTYGKITFRNLEPARETVVVADNRLQERLEVLCNALRSKY